MIFSSIIYLFFFFLIVLAAYYLVPRRWKNLCLVIFSLVFYAWGEPVYVCLLYTSSALENSGSKSPQTRMDTEKNGVTSFLSLQHGAGEGNRTPVFSLGSWCSAIELLPQRCNLSDALPFYHIFMGIAREKCGGETKLFFDAILQKSSIYFT